VSQIDVRSITQEYDTGDRRITALRDVSFTVGASEYPGTVKTELKVTLPRLRDPLLVEFLEYQREVIAHLTGSSDRR
jgi:hypothetical protein